MGKSTVILRLIRSSQDHFLTHISQPSLHDHHGTLWIVHSFSWTSCSPENAFALRSTSTLSQETATAEAAKRKEKDSAARTKEASKRHPVKDGWSKLRAVKVEEKASAGGAVCGARDEKAQQGGKTPLLSPIYEVAASAENVIGGAGDEQAQYIAFCSDFIFQTKF